MLCRLVKNKVIVKEFNSDIVYLETTRKCNLSCRHCFNKSGDSDSTMSFEYFIEVKEKIVKS